MTNEEFEVQLREAAHSMLRDSLDVDTYVNAVLDEMWDGESYRNSDGEMYHEIGSEYTKSRAPYVISGV